MNNASHFSPGRPVGPVPIASVIAVVAVSACSQPGGCSDRADVADLLDHAGDVQRSQGTDGFRPVASGESFGCDDQLRTAQAAWARVHIDGRGQIRLAENSQIRFRCSGAETSFRVDIGQASIVTERADVEIDLEIGQATLSRGGTFKLRSQDGKARFEVVEGSATVETATGPAERLEQGQWVEIEIGKAEVRRISRGSSESSGDRAMADAGSAAAAADAGSAAAAADAGSASGVPALIAVAQLRGKGNELRLPGTDRALRISAGRHELAPGATLRLDRRGSAEIFRGTERATVTGPARIEIAPPGRDLLDIGRGEVTVQATEHRVSVRAPGGRIEVQATTPGGSQTSIDVGRQKTRVRVLTGVTRIRGESGERESIQLGERAVLTARGRIEIYGRAPTRADLAIPAGESPTIHDPAPPTALGIGLAGLCHDVDAEGVIELSRSASFRGHVQISKGREQANVRLDRRTHHYRVRCLHRGILGQKIVARGRIRIVRDRGTRRLPRRAPENTVDADGRTWTVLYQNRLPEITFNWPDAPGSGRYRLHLRRSGGKARILTVEKPSYQAGVGELGDGIYHYFFAHAHARSETSTLRILFDNAASSAHVRTPAVGQNWSGESLEVTGAALPGSTVSVAGHDIVPDRQGRFRVAVSLPIAGDSIAIRTSHRRAGVHYYLRRNGANRP
ncbi:MAG: FecR family protein [Proteobacteria bacterium]|nr:FecR family protein [Pseudomonadota bacterium]